MYLEKKLTLIPLFKLKLYDIICCLSLKGHINQFPCGIISFNLKFQKYCPVITIKNWTFQIFRIRE